MKAAQRVVRDIRRVLQAGQVPKDMDAVALATEYAARCRDVNERLRLCQKFINSGLLTEALHEAESRPVLLDVAAALDFPEARKWTSLCLANGWSSAEEIDPASIRLLSNVYGMATALEPLKNEYRRAVPARDYKRCVTLLRQIMASEPDNRNWIEDLARFEEVRLIEIQREFTQADHDNDLMSLDALAAELAAKWVVNVAALRETVDAAALRVRRMDAMDAGRQILADIADAYSAFNVDALGSALQRYDELKQGGYFDPDQEMARQYDEAAEWQGQKLEQQRKEREFDETLSRLHAELDKDPPSREVERLWRTLTGYGRPLPDDLETRTKHAIESRRLWEIRRTRRIVVLTASSGLMALAVALFAVWQVQYGKARRFYIAELDRCYADLDLSGFQRTVEEAQRDRPMLIGGRLKDDPLWKSSVRRQAELKTRVEGHRSQLTELQRQLLDIQKRKFADTEQEITAVLKETERLSLTDADRTMCADFRRAWKTHTETLQLAQDEKLLKLVDEMTSIQSSMEMNRGNIDAMRAKIARLEECIKTGQLIPGASAATKQTFDLLVTGTRRQKKDVEDRARCVDSIRKATRLVDYVSAIREYAREFPQDTLSDSLKSVLDKADDYPLLAAVGPSGAKATPSSITRVRDSTRNVAADNYFWADSAKRFIEREDRFTNKWPEVRTALLSLRDDKTLLDLYSFQYQGRPMVVQGGYSGETFLSGNIYEPAPGDTVSRFSTKSLSRSFVRGVRRMGHCAEIEAMLNQANRTVPEDSETFLIQAISNATTNAGFLNSFLKLKFLKFLTGQLVELTGPGGIPEAEAALQAVNEVDDESLSWLCVANPVLSNKCVASSQVLSNHFARSWSSSVPRILHNIDRLALSRGVRWTGYVDVFTNLVWTSDARPPELWGLRGEAGPRRQVEVVAELSDKSVYRFLSPPLLGEPLMAPGDDKPTLFLVRDIIRTSGYTKEKLAELAWPAAWPVNRRSD